MPKKLTHNDYEDKLLEIESSLYPVEAYINYSTKINHCCIHGHITCIAPNSTLAGTGCSQCSGYKKKTTESYIEELIKEAFLMRPTEPYKGSKEYITHKCTICNHVAKRAPYKLLAGDDCKSCTNTPMSPAKLYYVRLNNKYYKIGVTQESNIKDRFRHDKLENLEVIWIKYFDTRIDAEAEERKILYINKAHVTKDKPLPTGGNSEVFDVDIFL